MTRELTREDAQNAVWGGSMLASGGGGWVRHGELMAQRIFEESGTPTLVGVDELDDDALVVTVTAIGAPAARNWEIRPEDYVRALELLIEAVQRPVAAVLTAQNGSSTTLNGWIQSASLGIPVLDAAGDVRAHPTGKLGALALTDRPGYETVQTTYGGNRERHGLLQLVTRGSVVTTSNILRDVSVHAGGFIAAARHPVEAAWVRRHAALGAISYALTLGAAMRAAAGDAGGVIDAVVATSGGRVLASGPVRTIDPLRTQGGFDHGTVEVDGHTVRYLNEYMTVDRDGERLSTYPDVLATLSLADGRPVAIADLTEGVEVALVVIPKELVPLSSSTSDRVALDEVERIMGVPITAPALAPAGIPVG